MSAPAAEGAPAAAGGAGAGAGRPGAVALELATPEALAASGAFRLVVAPGAEGDFGVLPGHAALVSSLRAGVVRAWPEGEEGGERRWFVPGGFAEVAGGGARLTLLVPSAEPVEALDAEALRARLRDLAEDAADLPADAGPERRGALARERALAEARLEAARRFGAAEGGA